ncbi:charon [Cochliomyia hominivorax]
MTTVEELKQNNTDEDNHKERYGLMKQIQTEVSNRSVIHVLSIQKEQITNPALKGTITMVPFKNITVIKSLFSKGSVVNADNKLQHLTAKIGNVSKAEVYEKRKRMLPEYKELFAALMKLSDKDMQKKLLSVINNHQTEYRSVETQTDLIEFKEATTTTEINSKEMFVEDSSPITELTNSNCKKDTQNRNDNFITVGEVIKKRKRKRKVSLPQANKESRAKQLAKMNKPKIVLASGKSSETVAPAQENSSSTKRQRMASLCISECSLDIFNTFEDTQTNYLWEWEHSNCPLENGLWPIQDAVVRNQINKLTLHIQIQQKKGTDLNDIITEEDEDLLQLAVLNTCDPSIVNLLLEKNLNPNNLDADSNTIVHLAILNDITAASLEHLMKRIDMKLLLTLNDDGYTPLHLAIRQDRFLLAERLINVLDERLENKVFYNRKLDELETDESLLRKQFKDYYEKVCLNMINDDDTITIYNHDLKQQLLQAGDRRSGNTALYFAIDNRYEHLIYFLLAHLTDPRTESLSGLDCKTYFSEYGKSLNLSFNIDNTMEKVIKLLS